MPELPEVETIARHLRDGKDGLPLVGQTVRHVDVLWERSIAQPSAAEFSRQVSGQTVQAVGRRGKFLIVHLERGACLFHLRMSGDLRIESELNPPQERSFFPQHNRILLSLTAPWRLVFNDPRKFGRAWWVADAAQVVGHLGPEALSDRFSGQDLFERLQVHRRRLKPLLLDQTFLAGLGNIYTDEALHLARLHPNRLASELTQAEAAQLWQAICTVLKEGIRRNGASFDWVYRGGDFQNSFRVYQRTGLPCPVCGTVIERRVVGQRGTHICPNCQPMP